jgi:GTP-binding protein HflX
MLKGVGNLMNANTVMVSGLNSTGIDSLIALIENEIHKFKKKYNILLPYSEQSLLSAMYNSYTVEDVEYLDTGISAVVTLDERGYGMYKRYVVSE